MSYIEMNMQIGFGLKTMVIMVPISNQFSCSIFRGKCVDSFLSLSHSEI